MRPQMTINLHRDGTRLPDLWSDHETETEAEPLPAAVHTGIGSDYRHERQTRITFTKTESTDQE
jgi:hypothetical protein